MGSFITLLPPFAGRFLVGRHDQFAAAPGREVANHRGLDIYSRLHLVSFCFNWRYYQIPAASRRSEHRRPNGYLDAWRLAREFVWLGSQWLFCWPSGRQVQHPRRRLLLRGIRSFGGRSVPDVAAGFNRLRGIRPTPRHGKLQPRPGTPTIKASGSDRRGGPQERTP